MTKTYFVFPALVLGVAALAHAQGQTQAAAPAAAPGPIPTKIATIHVANAIMGTKDGQTAANALNARFAPKKAEFDKRQSAIATLRDQLSKGTATMSPEARDKITRQIDSDTKALNRATEDAQSELDQEQQKVYNDLGGKLIAIVEQYATQNGYAVVLDVSNPQTSTVLWASAAIDITGEVIALYDKAHPQAAGGTAAPATPAARPAARPATSAPAQKKK